MIIWESQRVIRNARHTKGISLREVAEAIGCSIACVCKYELHGLGIGPEKAAAAVEFVEGRA